MNRRAFLRRALAVGTLTGLVPPGIAGAVANGAVRLPAHRRKLIVVQFGGGVRGSETINDPQHRCIPRLWNELVPRGTLCSNLRVEGPVVHPNATGSMMTGHWEWADLDWEKPLAHPTVFELYRRATGASDLKAWAFVYASILSKATESSVPGFGPRVAANVVVPPTIPREAAEDMDRHLREAAATGSDEAQSAAARTSAALARSASTISLAGLRSGAAREFIERQYTAWKQGSGSTSHDAFLADCALACMEEHAPDVLAVCFGEIDCAHYGAWSRYVEAIARTDALTWRLWQAVQALEEYRGRTLMLILPDHGRELDESGGLGFVHHSDFYTGNAVDEGCRRVWMLALGPDLPAGRTITEPIPITTVAATGLEYLGLQPSSGAAESLWSRLRVERRRSCLSAAPTNLRPQRWTKTHSAPVTRRDSLSPQRGEGGGEGWDRPQRSGRTAGS